MPDQIITPEQQTAALAEQSKKAMEDYNRSMKEAAETQKFINSQSETYVSLMQSQATQAGKLKDIYNNIGQGNNLQNFINSNIKATTVLGTAALGASDAFKSLSNANLGNINLFSSQIQEFTANTKNVNALADGFSRVFGGKIPNNILSGPIEGVKAFINAAAAGADNQLKLQQSFIGMSASSGNLGAVWNRAGENLQNLNSIVAEQNKSLDATTAATGLSKNQVVAFYQAMGQVPGALTGTLGSINSTTGGMTMLTAASKLAAGTGQGRAGSPCTLSYRCRPLPPDRSSYTILPAGRWSC